MRSSVLVAVLAGLLVLTGCSLFGESGSNGKAPAQTPWCDTQRISFQDDSTSDQTVLTNWSDVKDQLGFTVYLPASLPQGTCLALAGGAIHDPVFGGGHFGITYILPDKGPLAFTETPKKSGMSDSVQCATSATDTKTTVCQGAINGTSITIASRQPESAIRGYFSALQANANWVPSVATNATGTAVK